MDRFPAQINGRTIQASVDILDQQ